MNWFAIGLSTGLECVKLRFSLKTRRRNIIVHQLVPLELLTAGEEALIVDVDGETELVGRLAEMGLRQGVQLRMVQPGQPCIIAVGNHRLSFRGDEAASILVETQGRLPIR